MLSKCEKEKRTMKRKQLLAIAQDMELREEQNRELTFDYNSKEDYYRIIDSKKY